MNIGYSDIITNILKSNISEAAEFIKEENKNGK